MASDKTASTRSDVDAAPDGGDGEGSRDVGADGQSAVERSRDGGGAIDDGADDDGAAPGHRYRPGGELGRGAMGIVTAGFDPRLARDVALKRPRQDNPQGAARLRREARLTARLDHPAIAGVLDLVVDDDGAPMAVLQVRRGTDLVTAVGRGAADHPNKTLVRAMLMAARAVAHAHERGVLHRDLSPNNLRVTDDGAVSVLDWGLASSVEEAANLKARAGTPGYTAPEVEHGEGATVRSDVWSLGALLRVVCGERPVGGVWSGPGRPPRGCPPALWAIVRRAMADDPNARYVDASAFADDLEAFLDDDRVAAFAEGPLARLARHARRRPRVVATLVVAAVAVAVTIAGAGAATARATASRNREVALRLLDGADRALFADDDAGAATLAAASLEQLDSLGSLGGDDTDARRRARGILATLGRMPVLQPGPAVTVCPAATVLDGVDDDWLCRGDTRVERRHGALVVGGVDVAGVVDGCLLRHGALVVARGSAPGVPARATVVDDSGARDDVDVGEGTPQVVCSQTRMVATVASAEDLVVVDTRPAVAPARRRSSTSRPCPAGHPIRAAVPRDGGGAVVHCGDGSLVLQDDAGNTHPITITDEAMPRRGLATSTLLDDGHLVLASTSGRVVLVDIAAGTVGGAVDIGPGIIHTVTPLGGPRVLALTDRGAVLVDLAIGVGWPVDGGPHGPDTRALPAGSAAAPAHNTVAVRLTQGGDVVDIHQRPSRNSGLYRSTGLHGRSTLVAGRDAPVVVVGDGGGQVELLDLRHGIRRILDAGPPRVIKSVDLSPSGRQVAVGAAGPDGLMILNTATGTRRPSTFADNVSARGRHVAFLDEKTLVWFSYASLWEISIPPGDTPFDLGEPSSLLGPSGSVDVVDIDVVGGIDGRARRIAALQANGTVTIISRRPDGTLAGDVIGTVPSARALALSDDDGVVVAVGGDLLRLGVAADPPTTAGGDASQDPIDAVDVWGRLDATGRVALCRRSGQIEVLSGTLAPVLHVQAHRERCGDLSWCDDGRALCTASWDRRVRVIADAAWSTDEGS